MQKTLFNKVVTALSVLTVLLVFSSEAQAQVGKFRVAGKGKSPQGLNVNGSKNPYTARGGGNYLRAYTGSGEVVASPTSATTGTFTGFFKFEANGGTLRCTHDGTYEVFQGKRGRFYAIFIATFTPTVEGTSGRFVNNNGTFVMTATTKLFTFVSPTATSPFDFRWNGVGDLTFSN